MRTPRWLFLIFLLTTAVGAQVPDVDDTSQQPSSLLDFQTDTFTGRLAYEVPIVIPPARHNSHPEVKLRYNSGAGNGWCGLGWSLDMGFIQRDTKQGVPIQWDSASPSEPLTQYDDTKGFTFCFQGVASPLVHVSGNEYRARVEKKFLKFEFVDPEWIVTDTGGNKYYFGDTAESRMENPQPGWTPNCGACTFRWSISRIVDTTGNETFFEYDTEQDLSAPFPFSNQQYLKEIRYNGHVNGVNPTHFVRFHLEDRVDPLNPGISDNLLSFRSGYRVQTRKRLKEIVVEVIEGGLVKLVRSYELNYEHSPSTHRSLITSIKELGSDGVQFLPVTNFEYTEKPFNFEPIEEWGPLDSQGNTQNHWNTVTGRGSGSTVLKFADMNRDGFPDRVMRDTSSPYTYLATQLSTGAGFDPQLTFYWMPTTTGSGWASPQHENDSRTRIMLADVNSDGYLDRVRDCHFVSPNDQFTVEFGGPTGFGPQTDFGGFVDDQGQSGLGWNCPQASTNESSSKTYVALMDINGDGNADRVMRSAGSDYENLKVQLNDGTQFGPLRNWKQEATYAGGPDWNSIIANSFVGGSTTYRHQYVGMQDMNGDGLPDRVFRKLSAPFDKLIVQFNTGTGFEAPEDWGGNLDSQGRTHQIYNSPYGERHPSGFPSGDTATENTLRDINGDGLPDRVLIRDGTIFTGPELVVQLNTGTKFIEPAVSFGGIDSQGQNLWWGASANVDGSSDTPVDLVDMNGDGLVDRVMRKASSWGDGLQVQLSAGPVPDLMKRVENGIGGTLDVTYKPATEYDNTDANGEHLMRQPFPTVSTTTRSDGMGNVATTTYDYEGGMYSYEDKEFRGFHKVTETDPLGLKTITFYHQGGGVDGTLNGEVADAGSIGKKGYPYRVEVWQPDGSGGEEKLRQANYRVEELPLGNGRVQTYVLYHAITEYEGHDEQFGKSTLKGYTFDQQHGGATWVVDYGQITLLDPSTWGWADFGDDYVATYTQYHTGLANPEIINKPREIQMRSAFGLPVRLTQFDYDGNTGLMTERRKWLDTLGPDFTDPANFTVETFEYDILYKNVRRTVAADGLVTEFLFETEYHTFPEYMTVDPNGFAVQTHHDYDPRSGQIEYSTDPNGLLAEFRYDAFYRPTDRFLHLPSGFTVWQERTEYNLGGVSGGISQNYVRSRSNDGVDVINGHEVYTYSDGFGRSIQLRTEAESGAAGDWRVTDTVYDLNGRPTFQTLNYFANGAAHQAIPSGTDGTTVEYDGLGRPVSVTPQGGEPNSPTASVTSEYGATLNPYLTERLDERGNKKWTWRNARGLTEKIWEFGALIHQTHYYYDIMGSLTEVRDDQNNRTFIDYDSFGRRTQVDDPDSGVLQYQYDPMGRVTVQTDNMGNRVEMDYDILGRIETKRVYDNTGAQVETNNYFYDVSTSPDHTVYLGQLFEVTDSEGWTRNSYDEEGRLLKTTRYLNKTGEEYDLVYEYDVVGNVKTIQYPNDIAKLEYTYDSGRTLVQVESLYGTDGPEVFYQANEFDELGRLRDMDYGNGTNTQIDYYTYSRRLERIRVTHGTDTYQDLAYTQNESGFVESIQDQIASHTGNASATKTAITYDELNRLTSYTPSSGTPVTFDYDGIGNMLRNDEFGPGQYTYPNPGQPRPHAVLSANGKTYAYDDNGNMTTRGSQTLEYDAQNRLVRVINPSNQVTFGYDAVGQRLWKEKGNSLRLWIGGVYEERNGKKLCHVLAAGRLIATFQVGASNPQPTPVQGVVSLPSGAGSSGGSATTGGTVISQPSRIRVLPNPGPIFAYYHADHLGSTNMLTNRDGELIQHFENNAYGKQVYKKATGVFAPTDKFTSQAYDADTGLYYFNARYYDPELGRFIQPDSLVQEPTNPQNLNHYSYVLNNPFNLTDDSGHFFSFIIGIVVQLVTSYLAKTLALSFFEAVILGGLIGGAVAEIQGQDFEDGFLSGALGSALNQSVAIIGKELGVESLALGEPLNAGLSDTAQVLIEQEGDWDAALRAGALSFLTNLTNVEFGAEANSGNLWNRIISDLPSNTLAGAINGFKDTAFALVILDAPYGWDRSESIMQGITNGAAYGAAKTAWGHTGGKYLKGEAENTLNSPLTKNVNSYLFVVGNKVLEGIFKEKPIPHIPNKAPDVPF